MRSRRNKELGEARGRFREALRRHGLRWTAEREEILSALGDTAGHFTADELAERLRERGSSASRATVYRALPLLVEAGLVQPMILGGEVRRYESAVGRAHHDHLVCTACGRVVEFEFEAFEILQREVAARHGFSLVAHLHELFGICPECRRAAAQGPAEHAP